MLCKVYYGVGNIDSAFNSADQIIKWLYSNQIQLEAREGNRELGTVRVQFNANKGIWHCLMRKYWTAIPLITVKYSYIIYSFIAPVYESWWSLSGWTDFYKTSLRASTRKSAPIKYPHPNRLTVSQTRHTHRHQTYNIPVRLTTYLNNAGLATPIVTLRTYYSTVLAR